MARDASYRVSCAGIKQIRRCPTIHLHEERILLCQVRSAMKHDTSAAGQHAEPDRKLVVPPSVRWEKYSVTTRCSNMAGNAATVYAGSRARRTLSGICFPTQRSSGGLFWQKGGGLRNTFISRSANAARFVGLTLLILQTDKSTRSSARKCWSRFTTPA